MLILDVGLHARNPMSWIILENPFPWASAPTTWVTLFCFSWVTNPTPQLLCLSHVNAHILSLQSEESPHGRASVVRCPEGLSGLQGSITSSPSSIVFSRLPFAKWPLCILTAFGNACRILSFQVDALDVSCIVIETWLNTARHGKWIRENEPQSQIPSHKVKCFTKHKN